MANKAGHRRSAVSASFRQAATRSATRGRMGGLAVIRRRSLARVSASRMLAVLEGQPRMAPGPIPNGHGSTWPTTPKRGSPSGPACGQGQWRSTGDHSGATSCPISAVCRWARSTAP